MATIINSERIQLKNVRLSFPSLFEKTAFKGNDANKDKEGKYEATLLIPKTDTATKAKIDAMIAKAVSEAGFKIPSDKRCLRDGDEAEYEGYEGNWSLKASSKKRPTTLDRAKGVVTKDDDLFYPGCYVNAIVNFWIQDNDFGKRVNANLYGVQFFAHGETFGDSVDVTNDFDALEDDEL
jgi:hypothetical protein